MLYILTQITLPIISHYFTTSYNRVNLIKVWHLWNSFEALHPSFWKTCFHVRHHWCYSEIEEITWKWWPYSRMLSLLGDSIKDHVLLMNNECITKQEMTTSMKQGLITLIPKPGKDPRFLHFTKFKIPDFYQSQIPNLISK